MAGAEFGEFAAALHGTLSIDAEGHIFAGGKDAWYGPGQTSNIKLSSSYQMHSKQCLSPVVLLARALCA